MMKHKNYRLGLHRRVIDELKEYGIDNPTADDVLNHLIEREGDYEINCYVDNGTTLFNRINYIWITPIYFIFIAPFMWIKNGRVGAKRDSLLGRFLVFMLGEVY